jgi:hypothetical protein
MTAIQICQAVMTIYGQMSECVNEQGCNPMCLSSCLAGTYPFLGIPVSLPMLNSYFSQVASTYASSATRCEYPSCAAFCGTTLAPVANSAGTPAPTTLSGQTSDALLVGGDVWGVFGCLAVVAVVGGALG